MILPRRLLFAAARSPALRARSIAPLRHYSVETAAPSATNVPASGPIKGDFSTPEKAKQSVEHKLSETPKADVTLQKPSEDSKVKESENGDKPVAKSTATRYTSKQYTPRSNSRYAAKKETAPQTASSSSTPSSPKPSTHTKEPAKATPKPETVGYPKEQETASIASIDDIKDIPWTTSFYGVGQQSVSPEQHAILTEPVKPEDVEVKPDGIIYLPEVKYRRKLNAAFGPMGWGVVPRGEASVGNAIVTREYALIVGGRFVAEAQGVNNFFSTEAIPAAIEGCKSNALMRCCKDLGIASELWDPIYIRWFRKNHMQEVWVEHATTRKKRTFWYKKGEVNPPYPYKLC